MNTKMAVIKTKLNVIALESNLYLAVYNKFISIYCRDIINTTTSKKCDVVSHGNKKTHGGNIIIDRKL